LSVSRRLVERFISVATTMFSGFLVPYGDSIKADDKQGESVCRRYTDNESVSQSLSWKVSALAIQCHAKGSQSRIAHFSNMPRILSRMHIRSLLVRPVAPGTKEKPHENNCSLVRPNPDSNVRHVHSLASGWRIAAPHVLARALYNHNTVVTRHT
jgi:hypothetical protein